MATLIRLGRMLSARNTTNISKAKNVFRMIGTSGKKDDIKLDTEEIPFHKQWSSNGFDYEDEEFDTYATHSTYFFGVSVVLVGCSAVFCFQPDPDWKDWARREAYLQLRYKEEHGLPPIDCNLIDPSKIVLPTDEELGDIEIII